MLELMANTTIARPYREAVLAWLHLARVYSRLEDAHKEVLAAGGPTAAQLEVLCHIVGEPGLNQQELADRLLVTKGNVCTMLDRMERDGLVERRPNPSDRRANSIHPTDKGESRFAQAAPRLEAQIHSEMSELEGDELRRLRKTLGQLDRAFQARR